ncbi:putative Pantothenate transporter [Pleurostoma richardsiae]|uniref:Pantothenate transporter n=1 Tax=Pleurostoma richardsiae TaxID=41990 RepID=A0AA38R235_9PEZI|nr:putative Pantothenate transporter [Pleurostoma richardsiae]
MADNIASKTASVNAVARSSETSESEDVASSIAEKRTFRQRLKDVVWDSLDYSPEERRFISKIDFFILTWAGFSYFSKNLNSNNLSNAYVSGMKEELNVVGNEYQTFTTMWTIGYVISQLPSQAICTRVRLSVWCPSWELFWVVVTFATAAVKTPHHLYVCRFFVGLAEGTFYPAVHTVLGGWYTKRELAKRACIFFGSAFVGSMFSGYLQAALYSGMDGVHGLAGWRWLFIFDGVITLPMALWGYYALPDLPSNTRVRWLKKHEKELALRRMKAAGKDLEEPITVKGTVRVLKKWHFWVYTAYYTFFICSENIGSYMNLWLKSLHRYTVPQVNTYPTVTNAVTILTTLIYGWTSDAIQLRSPIVYFSLTVCFFAAMNLAIWDGVPFGLKWASFYLTGFAQGSGPVFLTMVNEACAGDSLERKIILGSTNSVAYAFNAWIPLITYNTNYAPRFLVGNSVTVGLIICAALTLTLAVFLERRDKRKNIRTLDTEVGEDALVGHGQEDDVKRSL